jgi:hypothetical protein
MLKRLIEVALPLKEVSEQSAREKSIRHGHISTLHMWWARRPLAACRAAVFASLIPDPDDPECPKDFRNLVMDLLTHERFRPTSEINGKKVEDTPRNRCLELTSRALNSHGTAMTKWTPRGAGAGPYSTATRSKASFSSTEATNPRSRRRN